MTYIMSCVWLDYMVKYFQCKNCVGSSPKTKKCVASFLVPVYKKGIGIFPGTFFLYNVKRAERLELFVHLFAEQKGT